MTALYAMLRLVWRPITLLQLAMVWVVVIVPLQDVAGVSEVVPVLRSLWLGTATPAMVTALWAVLALAPAGCGVIVAMNRIDMQHTTLSWQLPDLRRCLLTGVVALALPLPLVLAVMMSRNTSAAVAAAAFSLALYSFLLPGFGFDVAIPRLARLMMLLPALAITLRPGSTAQFAYDYPYLVTALGLVLAAIQLPAITSARKARARPFRWSALRQSRSRALYWASRNVRRPEWRRSLATERLLPWLRAAAYERNARAPYPLTHLALAAIAVLIVRLLDKPDFLPAYFGAYLMRTGLQLSTRIAYPLSRRRRAQLAYAGTVIDAATFFLILGVLLYATALVPLPRLPFIDWERSQPLEWVRMWGCSFALVPFAQWARIHWPEDDGKPSGTTLAAWLAWLLGYGLCVNVMSWLISESTRVAGDLEKTFIAIGLTAIVVQVIHAALVRAHYTSGDLVRARG